MMFLLDTNVVSALRTVDRGAEGLVAWSVATAADQYISVVTLYEIERGILMLARRDRQQADALRQWLDRSVLANFADRILPVDDSIARAAAALHVPDPRPIADAFLAATAIVHGLTLATRNVRDFTGTGAALLDPWSGAAG